jgi:hypothetical protein
MDKIGLSQNCMKKKLVVACSRNRKNHCEKFRENFHSQVHCKKTLVYPKVLKKAEMSHNTYTRKFYVMILIFFSLYRTKAAAHEMKSFKEKKPVQSRIAININWF